MNKQISSRLGPASSPLSHLAVVGDLVFTAGLGGRNPDTGELPEGIAAQTEQVLSNLSGLLGEVGLGLADVVKATVHLADPDRDKAHFNAVYEKIMPAPYPVRTAVGSTLGGILVEIDVVAARTPRATEGTG
jgi:2-iminobutanoate/2-iminopropanoate deaminase